jgi:hypothetical protein
MDDPIDPPHLPLPNVTLVQEQETEDQLLWFDGLLPLPIGSRINLDNIGESPQVPLDLERNDGSTAPGDASRAGGVGVGSRRRDLTTAQRSTVYREHRKR